MAQRTDHGTAPSAPQPLLGAVDFQLSGGLYERVWFVGADGKLHEHELKNNSTATWTSHDPPFGSEFTGYVAAVTGTYFGTRYVILGLTTTDGTLWRAVGYATSHTLYFSTAATSFDTGSQIASTKSPDESIWTFFARKADGTVGYFRWHSGWSNGNIGRPYDGANAGWSMSAAQGWLSATSYALHLWTPSDIGDSTIRLAVAPSSTSTSFVWTYTNLGAPPMGYFGVAGTARPVGSYTALDGFVHAVDDHLWRDTRTSSSWPWDAADLGTGQEMESNAGDSVATMSTGFGYSQVAWIGKLGSAHHVYSRESIGGPDDLWHFRAHGDGVPRHRVNAGSGNRHTEAMIDDWEGKVIAAAIVRPDNGDANPNDDYAYVQAMWSDDDGQTWGSPITMPMTAGGTPYNYTSDPVVSFTEGGTAYVALLAVAFAGNCGGLDNGRAFYYTTTTTGAPGSYTTPVVIQSGPGLDHGWMDIDRARTPDRLHFVWNNSSAVSYRCMDHGATCPTTGTECCVAPCTSPPCLGPVRNLNAAWGVGPGPATLSVGGDGGVYVAWLGSSNALQVCRLKSDLSQCEIAPMAMVGAWKMDPTNALIPGTGVPPQYIRILQSWSVAAAQRPLCPQECPTCGVLYYAFERQESAVAAKDVYASRGVYCPTSLPSPTWSWSAPVLVPAVGEDQRDQFSPTVTVLSDGGSGFDDTLFVSWYDRRENCAVTGLGNRCLRLKGAISRSAGTTWANEHDVQTGILTDPSLLPFHCRQPDLQRFIGDYREHAGNLLHSHYVWSAAPEDGPARAGQLWQSYVAHGYHGY